ncbi:hypothetical protein M9458_048315, partial [Cirrhinus mrigala]
HSGSGSEEGNVLQSRPVSENRHPARKAQHLPRASSPRSGETVRNHLQHGQPRLEER